MVIDRSRKQAYSQLEFISVNAFDSNGKYVGPSYIWQEFCQKSGKILHCFSTQLQLITNYYFGVESKDVVIKMWQIKCRQCTVQCILLNFAVGENQICRTAQNGLP